MRAMHSVRVGVSLTALVIGCGVMSGCLSSPTYGTDKTAGVQLLDDLGDIASVSAATPKEKGVKYPNRPGLVVAGDKDNLTQPQQSLASKDNPAWLESPEDARKRLATEADEKKNDVNYRSPLAQADSTRNRMTEAQQTAAYRAARQDQSGTYIDQRRYLIDPPQQYRQVADQAALNDLGTPESKKEKQRKKDAEAAQQSSNSSWWKPFQ
ncbi:hypothetical protein [Rhizobium sp. P44RR-XXIV]|uniref:hypothetical protein n=1 Tax=Rhizobium sp. P44RR-XXIV TaxID=1921145 RepID=UPI000985D540|nr:hypothetical protein [Rhizobium sp. P44RR-XXIV]TIX91889.1 hypothetical protein BSK43_005605 [Rhizobium sp. P44RR-XXIV]